MGIESLLVFTSWSSLNILCWPSTVQLPELFSRRMFLVLEVLGVIHLNLALWITDLEDAWLKTLAVTSKYRKLIWFSEFIDQELPYPVDRLSTLGPVVALTLCIYLLNYGCRKSALSNTQLYKKNCLMSTTAPLHKAWLVVVKWIVMVPFKKWIRLLTISCISQYIYHSWLLQSTGKCTVHGNSKCTAHNFYQWSIKYYQVYSLNIISQNIWWFKYSVIVLNEDLQYIRQLNIESIYCTKDTK